MSLILNRIAFFRIAQISNRLGRDVQHTSSMMKARLIRGDRSLLRPRGDGFYASDST